ncbi:MAG: NAD-glutamate dehydrogenase, partial [Xanthobacteraceae bacterium]|nr:NAD-glutamate dehydrogenase [Xanthobacteraceae bacterium]
MLHERAPEAPVDFVMRLFTGAASEDVLRYEPHELAELAAASWRFLAERAPRTAKIRVSNPEGGPRLQNVTVIELVNDDMPFLVDSVMGELNHRGLETHLLVHPVFRVARDAGGKLTIFGNGVDAAPLRESVIQAHVDRIHDEAARAALANALAGVLTDVRLAVQDWRSMLDRVGGIIDALKTNPPPLPEDEVVETIAFLEWLEDNNFTFLGVREYRLESDGGVLTGIPSSTLGVLRANHGEPGAVASGQIEMSPRERAAFEHPRLMLITKTSARSRVHRRVPMDTIGIKHFRDGRPSGGVQVVGLFTSTAYTRSTRNIPYLRRKVAGVVARAGFTPDSHSGRTLVNVLDTYPRDELFQIDEDTLVHFALIILQLNERPRVRVLTRFDWYERFASVLVYVPREPYGSSARAAIGRLLASAFDGEVASFVPYFTEGPLVRVHFIIARRDVPLANPDRAQLEADVSRVMKTWPDFLLEALLAAHDPAAGRDLFSRYSEAFSPTYRDAFSAATAVQDIATIEQMSAEAPLGVDFQRAGDGGARLKLWSHGRPLPLSTRVPVLEHMGFTVVDESTYHAEPAGRGGEQFWLHDMLLAFAAEGTAEFDAVRTKLDDCFAAVMC